jgi:DNA-binding response OmpR family regulator
MKTDKKRILVVDDEPSDTQLLKRFLEGTSQYEVREENHPLFAVSAAEEFEPQLIILDIKMPDMDGRELAGHFQANPKFKAVPIVFLTSKVTKQEVKLFGGQLGGYPFIAKPIVLTEVAACVKQQLSGVAKQYEHQIKADLRGG